MSKPNPVRYRYLVDLMHQEVYDTTKAKSLKHLVDNLTDENVRLRGENTKLKLTLLEIIDDLEEQAETREPIIISKKYVEWIRSECDTELEGFKKNE